jgi:uncharacterized protein YtpQ (UPF0354 family)
MAQLKRLAALLLLAVLGHGCADTPPVTAPATDPLLSPEFKSKIADPRLTETGFTDLAAQAAAFRMKSAIVTIAGPLHVAVALKDAGQQDWHLNNAWSECGKVPGARLDTLTRYLGVLDSAQKAPGSGAEVLRDVVPLIKDAVYMEEIRRATDGKMTLPHLPLAADLVIIFALDRPDSMAMLDEKEAKRLKMPLEKVLDVARDNLRKRLPPVKFSQYGPLLAVAADGNFEASLLLLDDVWKLVAERISGDLVAAVPARSTLLVTGEKSTGGVAKLREAAEKIHKAGDHPISTTLLVRRNGVWRPYATP